MNRFKITFSDIKGAVIDLLLIALRPTLFYVIWNYGLAYKSTIPEITFLQVIGIIGLFHLLISYVPVQIKHKDAN